MPSHAGAHRGAVAHVARRRTRLRRALGPGGFRSKIRTASPRASACSASTDAEVAAAAGDRGRERRPSEPVAAGEAPAHARPHAVEQRDRGLVAELLARPARCRTRSCPSARRARAAPARTGRRPARARRASPRPRPRCAGRRAGAGSTRSSPSASSASRDRLAARRAARTARRRRSSTRCPGAASTRLREQHALDEVARVDHRAALGAGPDEREAPARARPRGTASGGRAGTARRTTAAAGSPSRDRPGRSCAGRAARPRASNARSPCTARTASPRRSDRRSSGSRRTGEFDETCTKRAGAGAPRPVEHELRPADVHVEQLAHLARGMDHRGRVRSPTRRRRRRTAGRSTDGSRTSPTTTSIRGSTTSSERGVGRVVHEAADAPARGLRRERRARGSGRASRPRR